MCNLVTNLIILFLGKDGTEMMAMLWAQEIMQKETVEESHAMFKRVPRLLKDKVKQILINAGMEELIPAA